MKVQKTENKRRMNESDGDGEIKGKVRSDRHMGTRWTEIEEWSE